MKYLNNWNIFNESIKFYIVLNRGIDKSYRYYKHTGK